VVGCVRQGGWGARVEVGSQAMDQMIRPPTHCAVQICVPLCSCSNDSAAARCVQVRHRQEWQLGQPLAVVGPALSAKKFQPCSVALWSIATRGSIGCLVSTLVVSVNHQEELGIQVNPLLLCRTPQVLHGVLAGLIVTLCRRFRSQNACCSGDRRVFSESGTKQPGGI
jgi:hypothetical protein